MVLGTLLARNKTWAFNQLRSMFLYAFIPYLMMVQFADTSFKVFRYVRLFLLLSTFLVFLGITNKGLVPIPLLADENEFALFTNILIPIAYFLGQEANAQWKKALYYSLVIILILGTVTSFSRGGFVGLVSVGLFLFFKSNNKFTALITVGVLFSAVLFFGSKDYWNDIESIFTEGAQEGTGKDRWESWKAGWNMFLDYPILGVGPNNYGIFIADYYTGYGSKDPGIMWGRVAHSLYFTLLPETGLAGTLLFTLMLWNNYKDHRYIANLEKNKPKLLSQASLKKDESELVLVNVCIRRLYYFSLAYCGAMIAFLTTGAFISVLWYSYFWILTSFWVMSSNVATNIEQILLERIGTDGITLNRQTMTPSQGNFKKNACGFMEQKYKMVKKK